MTIHPTGRPTDVEDVEQDHPLLALLFLVGPPPSTIRFEPRRKVHALWIERRWHPRLRFDSLQIANPGNAVPEQSVTGKEVNDQLPAECLKPTLHR